MIDPFCCLRHKVISIVMGFQIVEKHVACVAFEETIAELNKANEKKLMRLRDLIVDDIVTYSS